MRNPRLQSLGTESFANGAKDEQPAERINKVYIVTLHMSWELAFAATFKMVELMALDTLLKSLFKEAGKAIWAASLR